MRGTYIHPRLKRVPDKIGFLEPLKDHFEEGLGKIFAPAYDSWKDGEFEFINVKHEITFSNSEEIEVFIQNLDSYRN